VPGLSRGFEVTKRKGDDHASRGTWQKHGDDADAMDVAGPDRRAGSADQGPWPSTKRAIEHFPDGRGAPAGKTATMSALCGLGDSSGLWRNGAGAW